MEQDSDLVLHDDYMVDEKLGMLHLLGMLIIIPT
jgi:hypothetical protein